jgi:NTE family protein
VTDGASPTRLGVILPGGGARAAYEVGVIRALAELWPAGLRPQPDILAGTSAGALNAIFLAGRIDDLGRGARDLAKLWSSLTVDQVYTHHWLQSWGRRWMWRHKLAEEPAGDSREGRRRRFGAFLDTAPLRRIVDTQVDWPAIGRHIEAGRLRGVAITATSYTDNRSVTFFQGAPDITGWTRVRRVGRPVRLTTDHIMASIALPILFPSVRIDGCDYGDGSLLQLTPLAPALHLGADRLLIIAVHAPQGQTAPTMPSPSPSPSPSPDAPSWMTIGGFLFNALFIEGIYLDLERLERINATLRSLAVPGGHLLRPVETLVLSPSVDPASLIAHHRDRISRWLRWMARETGPSSAGYAFESYLLFDGGYCHDLIELGYADTLARASEVLRFLEPLAGGERLADT